MIKIDFFPLLKPFIVGRGILDAPQVWCCIVFVLPTLGSNSAVCHQKPSQNQIPRRVWEAAPYNFFSCFVIACYFLF